MLSKITDPNDYAGPGTGYALTAERRAEIDPIRQARTAAELDADQAEHSGHVTFTDVETARQGSDPREVCIGLSPALGRTVWLSLCGLTVGEVLRQISAGLEEEGCVPRLVRIRSTIDVGMIGLTAARLSGSGIGIGLQGKGTALIHRRDLAPLANLELFSVAPLLTARMYRELGQERRKAREGDGARADLHRRHRRVDLRPLPRPRRRARRTRTRGLRARSKPPITVRLRLRALA